MRALRGERPERDLLRVAEPRAATARGGAAKGEHRTTRGDVLLSARVNVKRQTRCRVYEQNKAKAICFGTSAPWCGTSHEPCPTNGYVQVTIFSD